MAEYPLEIKEKAKELFLQGVSFRKIAEQLNIKQYVTVFKWKKKYNWSKEDKTCPTKSLKGQLDQCTVLVDKMRPKLDKINILKPSREDRELLLNYNRFSNLQLKLVRQLSGIKTSGKKKTKSNIFH